MLVLGMRGEDGVVGAVRAGWRRRVSVSVSVSVRVSGVRRRNIMKIEISPNVDFDRELGWV